MTQKPSAPTALDAQVIREARDVLVRLLDAVARGELGASRGHVERLTGALAALSALLGDNAGE